MRKGAFAFGIVCLVIGASLFFCFNNIIIWNELKNETINIPSKELLGHSWPLVNGQTVHFEYTASNEVSFYILDESNYEKFKLFTEGQIEPYDDVYYSKGESDSYTLRAPKGDTYCFFFCNYEENDVNVSYKISIEYMSMTGSFFVLSIFSFVLGLIAVILSLIIKPKIKTT